MSDMAKTLRYRSESLRVLLEGQSASYEYEYEGCSGRNAGQPSQALTNIKGYRSRYEYSYVVLSE
eukprot:scaffold11813_cov15-Prasinocladus_malaysianus.AAC.1